MGAGTYVHHSPDTGTKRPGSQRTKAKRRSRHARPWTVEVRSVGKVTVAQVAEIKGEVEGQGESWRGRPTRRNP